MLFLRKRRSTPGSAPGQLIRHEEALPPRFHLIEFDGETREERDLESVEEAAACLDPARVSWIDVQGLGDPEAFQRLGELFSIHPLVLEDMVNVPVRPKVESHAEYIFLVLRMVRVDENDEVSAEQVSLVVGPSWVITVQERAGDVFDPVRRRTVDGPRMRKRGADYLAYALLDAVLDGYYPVVEKLGEELESLEDTILEGRHRGMMARLHWVRHELLLLRRSVVPQREALSVVLREESPYFGEEARVFLRDCYDHIIQLSDVIESYRELTASLMDLQMSLVSQEMNQVMQVLTVMATIFIPLGFLAGVYGMNFKVMPELEWRWGYAAWWGVAAAMALGMLGVFRWKGWIGRRDDD
jgi:magnesium transporter